MTACGASGTQEWPKHLVCIRTRAGTSIPTVSPAHARKMTRLGLRVADLGMAAPNAADLRELAHPHRLPGETRLGGRHTVMVEPASGSRDLSICSPLPGGPPRAPGSGLHIDHRALACEAAPSVTRRHIRTRVAVGTACPGPTVAAIQPTRDRAIGGRVTREVQARATRTGRTSARSDEEDRAQEAAVLTERDGRGTP